MAIKPIIFNTEMVQAVLDGRKTQTRRVIKPQPVKEGVFWRLGHAIWSMDDRVTPLYGHSLYNRMPYKPDDVLWVRETWGIGTRPCPFNGWKDGVEFRADEAFLADEYEDLPLYHVDSEKLYKYFENPPKGWKPSIHMPKEVARIFLKVTGVRLERLQAITKEDVWNEGIVMEPFYHQEPEYYDQRHMIGLEYEQSVFAGMWDSINDKRGFGWESNPWVWVIEFERCEKPKEW